MLDLNSHRWRNLEHAYGSASDAPDLIRGLRPHSANPACKDEPEFSLWSSLCHQGDVYTASFAAMPHILEACRCHIAFPNTSMLQLIVCIEISRLQGRGPKIPADIREAYFTASVDLCDVISKAQYQKPSEDLACIGAAAFAVAAEKATLAQAFLEMTGELAPKFLDWIAE